MEQKQRFLRSNQTTGRKMKKKAGPQNCTLCEGAPLACALIEAKYPWSGGGHGKYVVGYIKAF